MWKRAGKGLSLIGGQGHDGRIHEMLQEDSRSSMYRVYDDITYAEKKRELRCNVSPVLYSLTLITHNYSLFGFLYSPY